MKRSGSSFAASCPFHADRTPSFRVFPDSKRFKCFGCGARGDVFEFLRRFEGKAFPAAVVNVELKSGRVPDPGLAVEVVRTLRQHRAEPRVVVSSFNAALLGAFRSLAPDVATGFLLAPGAIARGEPLLLMSALAQHTRNLRADPRACLLVSAAGRVLHLEDGRLR